jgi:hypothetical protein
MSDLGKLRESWNDIRREEIDLTQTLTIQESLTQWLQLQTSFEWQLKETEELFASQRHAALTELQARLSQLNSI